MVTAIKSKPTTTVDQAIAYAKNSNPKRPVDVVAYVREVYRLCQLPDVGMNPTVIIAQSSYETAIPGSGPWESNVWNMLLNPAGIGVTDDINRSLVYKTGEDAAFAQVFHMLAYCQGNTGWVRDNLAKGKQLDPQWPYLVNHPQFGKVRNVEDLGGGTWATQAKSTYSKNILSIMQVISNTPGPVSEDPADGTIGNPDYWSKDAAALLADIPIEWIGTQNYHARGMKPIAIVYHCTDDLVLDNTISWFQNPNSDASSTFVIGRDGTPYQFVSSLNAPWTNGDVSRWRTDIKWLAQACQEAANRGRNLNNYTISYEFVATPSVPPTEAQYKTAIQLSQYFCHPDVYGINPDRSHQLRHADINGTSRSYCPGPNFDLARIIRALGGDPAKMN